MNRIPIRLRLTLAFAVAMAAVLAGMGVFVYERVGGALMASVDQALRSQSSEAVAHSQRDQGRVDRDVGGSATLAQLIDTRGRVLESTRDDMPPMLSAADATRVVQGKTLRRSVTLKRPEGDWRLLALANSQGRAVVVAQSLEPREESLHRLLRELMLAGPLTLLLASLAGYLLAAGALRPVEAMRRRAAAVTADTPGRLPVPPGRDEISRLASTLNDMLGRLEAAFEHERRFVADASHELRTPLALLRAELEVTLRRPRSAAELEAALRSAAEEAERLSRLAEELLLIARADRGALPVRRVRVDADALLAGVATRFAARAATAGRELRVEESGITVDVDQERIEQALVNLVENALAHGSGAVRLFARERDRTVELHVADGGAGFPADFLPRAFDRFSRADEARGRGGSGLGLSIVALIAAAHGGDAAAVNRPEGGADTWISLPYSPLPPTPQRQRDMASPVTHS